MTDDELRTAILAARRIAEPVGSMHGMWDAIFDAECHLEGKRAILPRHVVERILTRFLQKQTSN